MSLSFCRLDPLQVGAFGLFDDLFQDEAFDFLLDQDEDANLEEKAPAKGKGGRGGSRKRSAPAKSTEVTRQPTPSHELNLKNQPHLWKPKLDCIERSNQYVIRADLPGVTKEDIHIELDDEQGILTISGERRLEHVEEHKRVHRVERRFGRFVRSLKVPEGVTSDDIKATLKDGQLEIELPKPSVKEQKKEAKRIKID